MAAVNEVNNFEALGLTRKPEVKEKDDLGMDDFLELMVTQLTNQDPTKPLDSQDFLGQIAQFTTVSGIEEMNSNMTSLASSLTSSQGLEASTLVGRDIYFQSDTVSLEAGNVVSGSVELGSSAANVVVRISGLGGQLIKELNLGQQSAGTARFNWDGLNDAGEFAGEGTYKIEVLSESGEQSIALDPLISARVDSVLLGQAGQAPTLNLAGLGSIGFDQVRQIK
jgi:flagellar basal-body rod modification protein FlgD